MIRAELVLVVEVDDSIESVFTKQEGTSRVNNTETLLIGGKETIWNIKEAEDTPQKMATKK